MDKVETTIQAIDYVLREKTKTINFLRNRNEELQQENKTLKARVMELEHEKYIAAKSQQKNEEATNA